MHPLIRSTKHFFLILLIWAPFCVYLTIFVSKMAQVTMLDATILAIPPLFILPFISLSNWYLCKNTSFDAMNFFNFIIIHLVAVIVSIGIWISLSVSYAFLLDYFLELNIWQFRMMRISPLLIVIGSGVYFLAVFFNYLAIAMEKNKELTQKALENSLAYSQSAYKALRATIHPHFLFNSLNALSILTLKNPEIAHKISLQLSDFMRYSLRLQKKEIVPVEDEVSHMRNYLGIEEIRLGERLTLNFQIEDDIMKIPVLSFILLPLVENAIKHGIQELIDGGTLTVMIRKHGEKLHIEVGNPYEEMHKSLKGEGMGLSTLRNRLQLTYGDKGKLEVIKDECYFRVIIELPVQE